MDTPEDAPGDAPEPEPNPGGARRSRRPIHRTLVDLLARVGVGKSSAIRVTGRGGLAALLWLCRRGYQQVSFARHGRCPSEGCDMILLLEEDERQAIADIAEQGTHLRGGGVLVVQFERGGPRRRAVETALRRSGFAIEGRVRGAHRELSVARRAPRSMRVAA